MAEGLAQLVGTYGDTSSGGTSPWEKLGATSGSTLDKLLPSKEETKGYAKITRDQVAANETARREVEQRGESFREFAIKQYNATGVDPSKFQKWDAQQEWDKRQTQPLEAFGSLGSVFGMIASAFTHAPMENALNASAAAMNAIHAGDRDSYERAHEAWKQNIDLAMKRQQMEREHYLDAFKLFDTDMRLGEAKMKDVAARFGDQKTLWMIDHGMIPELFQMHADRANMISQITKASSDITTNTLQERFYDAGAKEIEANIKDATERGRALLALRNNIMFTGMKPNDPQAQANGQFIVEIAKKYGRSPTSAEWIEQERKIEDARWAGHQRPASAATPHELADRAKQYETDPSSPTYKDHKASYDRAAHEIKQANRGVLTEGQQQKIEEKERTVEAVTNQVDRARQLIREAAFKGESVTGVRGAYGRAKEFMFGGDTRQAEFEDLIRTIQREVKPLISGTTRLSKEDMKVMDTIVPGLGFLRNMEQVDAGLAQLEKILRKQDLLAHPEEEVILNGYRKKPGTKGDKEEDWEKLP